MKRIKAIVSILALAVVAIAMMGCVVGYPEVASPYVTTPGSVVNAAGKVVIPVSSALKAAFVTKPATSVTVNFDIVTGSDWNFGLTVVPSGGGIAAAANFVSTYNPGDVEATSWWSTGYAGGSPATNWIHLGGTINTYGTAAPNHVTSITGGTTLSPTVGGTSTLPGNSLTYTFNGASGDDLTLTVKDYYSGAINITSVDIVF